MKRIILAIGSISISQVLPLLSKPELIFDKRNLVIMIVNAAVWLTQPPVSTAEMRENKSRDKFSVLLILFFSIGSIIVSVTDWAYSKVNFFSFYIFVIGIIFIAFGLLLRFWSIQVLGKFFTATVQIKDDHKLVTKGPYSILRHPSYLGAWLSIEGSAIYFGSYIGFLVAFIGMGISYYFRIKFEEKALIELFGEQYINYQTRVKKILPFIW